MVLGLATVVYLVAVNLPFKFWRRITPVLFVGSLGLLLITALTPLANVAGGARRWLEIGGLRFQPSELMRLTVVLMLAHWALQKGTAIRSKPRELLKPLAILASVCLIVLSAPDFGSAVSIGVSGLAVLYVAGAPLKALAATVMFAVPAAVYGLLGSAYRRERLLAFLDPWRDPMDSGFQIIQSFVAIRSGGLFGQGIGDGVQKIFYLPEAHTDFVFAVLAEELGFVGISAVVMLFALLVWRGALIALRSQDRFATVVACGLTFTIGMQAIINMGVVLGMLPTKGLTLPLLSFGGSSLITNLVAIGILQSIAKTVPRSSS
jgi:cell division protein FtsW